MPLMPPRITVGGHDLQQLTVATGLLRWALDNGWQGDAFVRAAEALLLCCEHTLDAHRLYDVLAGGVAPCAAVDERGVGPHPPAVPAPPLGDEVDGS